MPMRRELSRTSSAPIFCCFIRRAASTTVVVFAALIGVCPATMERIERIDMTVSAQRELQLSPRRRNNVKRVADDCQSPFCPLAHRIRKLSLKLFRLDGFLPQQMYLRMRFHVGLHLRLLLRALLATNPSERLPQVGFDAVGVTERTVEYGFHALSFIA